MPPPDNDGKAPTFLNTQDVIARVLKRESKTEATAADAYLELIKRRNAQLSPSRSSSRNMTTHFAWKDERTHYEKASSRIGNEYQVHVLPSAGSHMTSTTDTDGHDGGPLFERVWDPKEAEKSGKLDFIHTRVTFSKKEAAYGIFSARGYRLPGFYQELSHVSPTNCSHWTNDDREDFRKAVFEKHENMKEVSKMVGKPISECITYYLSNFKRTKSYKKLKRSMRKANVDNDGNADTLLCNECKKGGMLIACDTREAHYHLACASPPLASIPDGAWYCGNCKRDTRSMMSKEDEVGCGLNSGGIALQEDSGAESNDGSDGGDDSKRKLDDVADLQAVVGEGSEESNRSNKKMKAAEVGVALSVVPAA